MDAVEEDCLEDDFKKTFSFPNADIYTATRAGDLQRVKYLVEVAEVDVNEKNEFQATPLFYACLCGHKELVEYLLEQGAILDATTFEGYRCYYAALTEEIHHILRTYKAKPKNYNSLLENFRQLLANQTMSDITFVIKSTEVKAHKILMSTNCAYLKQNLDTRWKDRDIVTPKHGLMSVEAFEGLLSYLYTNSVNILVEYVPSLLLLAKQCKLSQLEQLIEAELDNLHDMKRLIIVPPPIEELEDDLPLIANMRSLVNKIKRGENTEYSDFSIIVEDKVYHCHKVILASRSEYFRSLLCGNFRESSSDVLKVPQLSSEVYELLLEFIYTNDVYFTQDTDIVLELLQVANLYLLPELKRLCVNHLIKQINEDNMFEYLHCAEVFNIYRLSESCLEKIAENFEVIWMKPDLKVFLEEISNPMEMEIKIKEAVEEHLCHYGQKQKWLKIEELWDQLLERKRTKSVEELAKEIDAATNYIAFRSHLLKRYIDAGGLDQNKQ